MSDEDVAVWEEDILTNLKTNRYEDYFAETLNDNKVIVIGQLHGNDDLSFSEDEQPCKGIYAVNYSDKTVINIINFFRSINLFWISTQSHQLCSLDQNCFFL